MTFPFEPSKKLTDELVKRLVAATVREMEGKSPSDDVAEAIVDRVKKKWSFTFRPYQRRAAVEFVRAYVEHFRATWKPVEEAAEQAVAEVIAEAVPAPEQRNPTPPELQRADTMPPPAGEALEPSAEVASAETQRADTIPPPAEQADSTYHWDALAGDRYKGGLLKASRPVTHLVSERTDEALCGAGKPGAWIETDTGDTRCAKCLAKSKRVKDLRIVPSLNTLDEPVIPPPPALPALESELRPSSAADDEAMMGERLRAAEQASDAADTRSETQRRWDEYRATRKAADEAWEQHAKTERGTPEHREALAVAMRADRAAREAERAQHTGALVSMVEEVKAALPKNYEFETRDFVPDLAGLDTRPDNAMAFYVATKTDSCVLSLWYGKGDYRYAVANYDSTGRPRYEFAMVFDTGARTAKQIRREFAK